MGYVTSFWKQEKTDTVCTHRGKFLLSPKQEETALARAPGGHKRSCLPRSLWSLLAPAWAARPRSIELLQVWPGGRGSGPASGSARGQRASPVPGRHPVSQRTTEGAQTTGELESNPTSVPPKKSSTFSGEKPTGDQLFKCHFFPFWRHFTSIGYLLPFLF